MFKKIAIVTLASLALGGCSLNDYLPTNQAVTDEKKEVVATSTPAPSALQPDQGIDSMKPTSSSTDVTSLETDINNTVILEEDFSDLK